MYDFVTEQVFLLWSSIRWSLLYEYFFLVSQKMIGPFVIVDKAYIADNHFFM